MSRRGLLARTGFLLVPPEVVSSPETGLQYRVDRMLGEGGYGQAYLATRLKRSRAVPAAVCKTTLFPKRFPPLPRAGEGGGEGDEERVAAEE